MNKKDKLYYDLIEAYRNHSCNDTLIDTYIYKVLKLVKDYLDFDNLKKENEELKEQNTKMFVELSNTVLVLNKFFEYLDKDKTKLIAKYSLKETLYKIVDKVVKND